MPKQVSPCLPHQAARPVQPGDTPAQGGQRTRIIVSDHKRLVVTYSELENTVYLFCPPGEDPMTVLGAARLVLHDQSYQELAWRLGMAPSGHGPREATG